MLIESILKLVLTTQSQCANFIGAPTLFCASYRYCPASWRALCTLFLLIKYSGFYVFSVSVCRHVDIHGKRSKKPTLYYKQNFFKMSSSINYKIIMPYDLAVFAVSSLRPVLLNHL